MSVLTGFTPRYYFFIALYALYAPHKSIVAVPTTRGMPNITVDDTALKIVVAVKRVFDFLPGRVLRSSA